jgi:hypothetical protein
MHVSDGHSRPYMTWLSSVSVPYVGTLWLQGNMLTGTIPSVINSMTALSKLHAVCREIAIGFAASLLTGFLILSYVY